LAASVSGEGMFLSGFARAGATCVLHFWNDPDGANRKDADALAAQLHARRRLGAGQTRAHHA
jgi:hypothetical protein